MKKFVAVLAVTLALGAGAALAQDMPNNDNNTFVVTEASGTVLRYHFNTNGTWDVVTPDGHSVNGTYTAQGNQICLTATGQTQARCVESHPDKHVGDTWTQIDSDGSQISVSLVAGRP